MAEKDKETEQLKEEEEEREKHQWGQMRSKGMEQRQ